MLLWIIESNGVWNLCSLLDMLYNRSLSFMAFYISFSIEHLFCVIVPILVLFRTSRTKCIEAHFWSVKEKCGNSLSSHVLASINQSCHWRASRSSCISSSLNTWGTLPCPAKDLGFKSSIPTSASSMTSCNSVLIRIPALLRPVLECFSVLMLNLLKEMETSYWNHNMCSTTLK